MGPTKQSVKLNLEAQRRRALTPEYDPVRCDFDLGLAHEMEMEAQVLPPPAQPSGHLLKTASPPQAS